MKKLITLLLILSIINSLMLPAAAAESDEMPLTEWELSFDPASSVLYDSKDAIEYIQARINVPSRRNTMEDNLVFPGPMLEDHSFTPGSRSVFAVGTIYTGKVGQYYCLLVYKGSEPEGDPVCVMYDYFGSQEGMYTKYFIVNTSDWEIGQYTAVTCTAVLQGDVLQAVENTAFMTHIYCNSESSTPETYMLRDPDTKERTDHIFIDPEMINIIELGRSPVPSYGSTSYDVICDQKLVDIQNAGGILFLTPLRYGSGELKIEFKDGAIYTAHIDVCIDQAGHNFYTIAEAADPSVNREGYVVKGCFKCNCVVRERIPSKMESFQHLKDIPQDSWYYNYVQEAFFRDLFKGVSSDAFEPEQAMTRSMLVTVLWRYEGSPEAADGRFTDVPQNVWYTEAVNWAASKEIVNGIGKGEFDPEGKITREQMAVILYRYAKWKGLNTEVLGSFESFVDGALVSPWAYEGLAWTIGHGIIGGVKDGNVLSLQPQGDATRAQVSAILIRFIQNISEPPRAPEIPDTENALDYGEWNELYWAFYPEGLLIIGGNAAIPYSKAVPWKDYISEISQIELLYGIESVGHDAFRDYTSLQSVRMADSVTELEEEAFSGCINLSEIALSQGLESIKYSVFQDCAALQQIDLPNGLRHLGNRVFEDCSSLQGIVIPDSVTDLGSRVFSGCVSLKYAVLPIAVTNLGEYMFANCNIMTEVVLPACLEYLGWQTFFRCYALERVTIPQNLLRIRYGSFSFCTALKEVYVLSPYFEIDEAFSGGNIREKYPFGYWDQVTVYSYLGSSAQQIANRFHYKFIDIQEIGG